MTEKDVQELVEIVSAKAKKATPDAVLETQIMDSRIPKNEREHWASRRIAELQSQLVAMQRLLSCWRETWNDGFNPDGDLLDDTDKAIEWEMGDSHE